MDVTKHNFLEVLPEFEEAINKCNFLSIDCEFTGISTENNLNAFDRPEDAYKKLLHNSSGYITIQVGFTCVSSAPDDNNKITYRSYNFYVYPRSRKNSFKCQGSSMEFLAKNGFDFNKLFGEGISFCNTEEEKIHRDRFERQQQQRITADGQSDSNNMQQNFIPVPDDEKELLDKAKQIIKDFIDSSESEKEIGNCNNFQRKLIYELIYSNFRNDISASTKTLDNNIKVILIEHKKSEEEKKLIEEQKKDNELAELNQLIGFSAILQKVSSSKKLLVGHNMLLDVIFVLRQFFEPLPVTDFVEFKKKLHQTFPSLLDTKLMCTHNNFKEFIKISVLNQLYESLRKPPFKIIDIDCETEYSYSQDNTKEHNAGYDSYLTAKVFVSLAEHLKIPLHKLGANCGELKPFLNKIFLMKVNDINFINVVGLEPRPSRDHVFRITVPETWKQSDIVHHFRNYGPIFINWINSTSCFVALQNRENAGAVKGTIGKCAGFQIESYNEFHEIKKTEDSASSISTIKRKHNESESKERNQHPKSKTSKRMKSTHKTFTENDDW